MERWNKSGQFYLIAAMVIISIVIGVLTVSNSSIIKKGPEIIYDLEGTLKVESEHVLNYGITNNLNNTALMENFTRDFSNNSKGFEFYFIFGEKDKLRAYKYFNGERETINYLVSNNQTNITIGEITYVFNLKDGENFYYIIFDEDGDKKYVASNAQESIGSDSSSGSGGEGESCTPDCSGSIDSWTKLLLHVNTNFTDSSSSGHTVTPNGDAQISSSQSQIGAGSVYFDGNGDYLSIPDSADWDFGSGDFTIDFWIYKTTSGSEAFITQWDNTNSRKSWDFGYESGAHVLEFYYSTDGTNTFSKTVSWTPNINTWYHLALVRNGTDLRFFVNGTQVGSTQTLTDTLYNSNWNLAVGCIYGSGAPYSYLSGYIDELRISKGIARWTENFTPPTAPYPIDNECGDDGCEGSCGSCDGGETCQSGACAPPPAPDCGQDLSTTRTSCLDILNTCSEKQNQDGTYYINPTGSSAFQVYCDMTTDGRGWTLVARLWNNYEGENQEHWTSSAVRTTPLLPTDSNVKKLSDVVINQILTEQVRLNSDVDSGGGPQAYCKLSDNNYIDWDSDTYTNSWTKCSYTYGGTVRTGSISSSIYGFDLWQNYDYTCWFMDYPGRKCVHYSQGYGCSGDLAGTFWVR